MARPFHTMTAFSSMSLQRPDCLTALRRTPEVSVLIIGAGINGCGVFRDLACQGIDTLLVDQGDFCTGTSAASSHLIHGGLRYLEYGDFRLVKEALQERNRLLHNAAHFVKPLPTRIPLYTRASGLLNAPLRWLGGRRPDAARGAWLVRLGLALYDLYSNTVPNELPASSLSSRARSLARFPHLNPGIIGTAQYHDALILHPERLGLELVQDGVRRHTGCRALNYVRVTSIDTDGVVLRDETDQAQYRVRPRLIVNTAGPWIDRVNRALGRDTSFIGGTKGSHLVLAHQSLSDALQGHMFFFENTDGRITLICPFHHRVLVGTTDIRVDSPDDAVCTEEEEIYLLAMIRQVFPDINVSARDIVYRYSGVRPLGAATGPAAAISRDHQLHQLPAQTGVPPIYSLIGGKWTTFRAFAAQTTDALLAALEIPRRVSTLDMAIGGGAAYPATDADFVHQSRRLADRTGLDESTCTRLLHRYGMLPAGMVEYLSQPAHAVECLADSDYLHAEVAYMCRHEMVVHLDDLILRRSLMAMLGQLTPALLAALADVAAEAGDWTPAQRATELQRTRRILKQYHGVEI